MKNFISLIFSFIIFVVTPAYSQDDFQVQVRKNPPKKECYQGKCTIVNLVPPKNLGGYHPQNISDCENFWMYRKVGWRSQKRNYNNDYRFIENCNILKFKQEAKPSQNSHFSSPFMAKYKIKILNSYFTNFIPAGSNIELKNGGLIVVHGDRHTSYFTAGKGDINNDGWEDLLMNYYSYEFTDADSGPDRISGHFCLSWRDGEESPTAFDCVDDNFFEYFKKVQ